MNNVPSEILMEFMSYLPYRHLMSMCRTGTRPASVCRTRYFWRLWSQHHKMKPKEVNYLFRSVPIARLRMIDWTYTNPRLLDKVRVLRITQARKLQILRLLKKQEAISERRYATLKKQIETPRRGTPRKLF